MRELLLVLIVEWKAARFGRGCVCFFLFRAVVVFFFFEVYAMCRVDTVFDRMLCACCVVDGIWVEYMVDKKLEKYGSEIS